MTKQLLGHISCLGRCTFGAAALVASGTFADGHAHPNNDPIMETLMMQANIITQVITQCDGIDARPKWVAQLVDNVQKHFQIEGYSQEDQQVFSSPEFSVVIEQISAEYMKANGVVAGDENSLCTFGLSEISNRTAIGKHLRKN